MESSARSYPIWNAPAEDGAFLVWPGPGELLHQTMENHRRLGVASTRLQNVPLNEVRQAMRMWMGHRNNDQPLIGTGHQAEMYHPGVWVKNILIDRVARKLGGDAIHFAVDTDAPKHLELRWPGGKMPITDDPVASSAAWSGLVQMPTPKHLATVEAALAHAATGWEFRPELPVVFAILRTLMMERVELSAALTNGNHRLDWELGLRHQATVVSPMFFSEPYLLFVHHILARAGEFAMAYNGALARFRKQHGVRSTQRPMPDLKCTHETCEVPFWLDDLAAGRRQRAVVWAVADGWALRVGEAEFGFKKAAQGWAAAEELATWMRGRQIRLSPRALTLTMFLRLLLLDQFVHGIGGGLYDQVNDDLIASHCGIEPPPFCVTTATMFFPGASARERVCLPCVAHEGHHLRHAVLGEAKRDMVRAINAMPRYSLQRTGIFARMREAIMAAAESNTPLQQWQRRWAEAVVREEQNRELFDREMYYAVQPRQRLMDMIERYGVWLEPF